MLSDAKMKVTELQKEVSRKRFGIEACRDSDKDVWFYTGLPSVAEFYQLLEYLSPSGKKPNVVYSAMTQNWEKEGSVAYPGNFFNFSSYSSFAFLPIKCKDILTLS